MTHQEIQEIRNMYDTDLNMTLARLSELTGLSVIELKRILLEDNQELLELLDE